MVKETVKRLEAVIRKLGAKDRKKLSELIALLTKLKSEVAGMEERHGRHAKRIAGFAESLAEEASRKERSPKRLKPSLEGLAGSVEGLEASHPRLVQAVNDVCTFLAGLGI